MTKKVSMILVPTDYSTCSAEAIRWAVSLAGPLSADLLLLHVIAQDIADDLLSIPGMSWEVLVRREERALRELFESSVEDEGDISFLKKTLVAMGDPAGKIVTAALEMQADLIVIPTYGHRDPSPGSVGSVTERVVRTATCPVLTLQAACCERLWRDTADVL